MHRQQHFKFVGLMEPMQQSRKLDRYKKRISFAQAFVNISNKNCAFVDENYEVTVIFDMEQRMTLRLVDSNSQQEVILTLVYAKCDAIQRIKMWDTLYALASDMVTPWIVGDDFNVVSSLGGMEGLKKIAFLREHATFQDVVKENGTIDFSSNPFIIFNHNLKKLKRALSVWSRATYGDIFQKIASLEEVVLVHEAQFEINPTKLNRESLNKVQAELIRVLSLEEKFWKQKSCMSWFKDGDRNTKLFHAKVNGRRRRLQLNRIQNSEGN
ncbi:uncharacterized protein LOC107800146 [Nicotiana tabacum]|uniref:Uncharacterized protein LOC107800146 n=1 Tax=Nicotiana tabacum TaxID=4097 RepID=A0AC58RWN3_TOBAC